MAKWYKKVANKVGNTLDKISNPITTGLSGVIANRFTNGKGSTMNGVADYVTDYVTDYVAQSDYLKDGNQTTQEDTVVTDTQPISEETIETNNEIAESVGSENQNWWKMYQNTVAQNAVNQKAELDAINQRANSYVNSYLKNLGLGGTSEGVSQITSNAYNLSKAYSDINANQEATLENARENNANNLATLYQQAIENGASARTLQQIADKYDDDSVSAGTKENLDSYAELNGVSWENDRSYIVQGLSDIDTSNLTVGQKVSLSNIISEMENAKSSDEFYDLYDKYENAIQNPSELEDMSFNENGYTKDEAYNLIISMLSGGAKDDAKDVLEGINYFANPKENKTYSLGNSQLKDYKITYKNGKYYFTKA